MAKKKSKKKLIISLTTVFSLIAVIVASFFIYISVYNHATDHALEYMQDSTLSEVKDRDDYVSFQPKANKVVTITTQGLIFYPGGKVEYKSYAPLLRSLSDLGITSVLVKMPFNLAVFNPNGAKGKQSLFPNVTSWYIGGHSLGGAMASNYLSSHHEEYKGLILMGSYSTKDLSSYTNLSTLSLLAENDKVLNKEKYESYKKNLPNLTEMTIEGGIHSYFGDYGIQSKDGTPSITQEEQNSKMVTYITTYIFASSIIS